MGFETHRGRISLILSRHDGNVDAIGPDLELLNGRSAESVCSCEHDAVPVSFEIGRQFRHGSGFADPVDAGNQDHSGFAGFTRRRHRNGGASEDGGDLLFAGIDYGLSIEFTFLFL